MPQLLSVLSRKLCIAADLSSSDMNALAAAVEQIREVPARTRLIEEGERPDYVHVVLRGFAYRYKVLPDGNRQVLAWLVPGDFCDLHVALLGEMDHTISTVSPSVVGRIPTESVDRITNTIPALSHALWWASLVQEAILREWLVNLGRRPAESRMAHFFCELHARLAAVGLVRGATVAFPLTQVELADTLGLSAVHVNRTLQALRQAGLIELRDKALVLKDLERLKELAQFSEAYLHLPRRRAAAGRHNTRRARRPPQGSPCEARRYV